MNRTWGGEINCWKFAKLPPRGHQNFGSDGTDDFGTGYISQGHFLSVSVMTFDVKLNYQHAIWVITRLFEIKYGRQHKLQYIRSAKQKLRTVSQTMMAATAGLLRQRAA